MVVTGHVVLFHQPIIIIGSGKPIGRLLKLLFVPAQPAPAASSAGPSGAGRIAVKAGAAGKVFKIEASVGQSVQPGDPVVIIEAMKMEIPVVAPEAGTVASIDVAVGDAIEAGAVLATLN